MTITPELSIIKTALEHYLTINYGPDSAHPVDPHALKQIHFDPDEASNLEGMLREHAGIFSGSEDCLIPLAEEASPVDGSGPSALDYMRSTIRSGIVNADKAGVEINPDDLISQMQAVYREVAPKRFAGAALRKQRNVERPQNRSLLDDKEINTAISSALSNYLFATHGPEILNGEKKSTPHFYQEPEAENIALLVEKMLPTFASEQSCRSILENAVSPSGSGSAMDFFKTQCSGGLRSPDVTIDADTFLTYLQASVRDAVKQKASVAEVRA